MKNLFLILFLTAAGIFTMSFTNETLVATPDGDTSFEVPEDVQVILDKSCYMCHNSDSKSTKGKMKLDFDKLSTLKDSKLVGKMMKISKTVKNGKMPKKSFIEKYPDKALTTEESERLTSWADSFVVDHGGE